MIGVTKGFKSKATKEEQEEIKSAATRAITNAVDYGMTYDEMSPDDINSITFIHSFQFLQPLKSICITFLFFINQLLLIVPVLVL